MSAFKHALGPALIEGAGLFALAFLGADLMFGAEFGTLGLSATLPAALAAGVGLVAYRLSE
jgi:hypothetical protein